MTENGNEFRPASANLPKNDAVVLVDEKRTNRTNIVWRIGRVEYTSMADTEQSDKPASENSVHLCKSVSEKNSLCPLCSRWLKKQRKSAKPCVAPASRFAGEAKRRGR